MSDSGSTMDARPLDPAVRIEDFEESAVTSDDVLAMWAREDAVVGEEAQRRVQEVLLVATLADTGELVGVSTAVVQRSAQLQMDMWYLRALVSESRRTRNVASHLLDRGRQVLEQRFVDGSDVRGAGVLIDVQNEGVKQAMTAAVWSSTRLMFVGENQRGDHVRVRYFPGATVPPPISGVGPTT